MKPSGARVVFAVRANSASLTERQERLLVFAAASGYYDFPRRVSLTRLAEKVGVAPSTLSEILRGAEKRIVTAYADAVRSTR